MQCLHSARQLASRTRLLRSPTKFALSHALRAHSTLHTQSVTKVEKLILDTIKATGPISFSDYMSLCLAHPTYGYYTKPLHEILGARGDFITSPEISQVFGELVGLWLLSQWFTCAMSCPIRIVELGPGTGTLMDDMLRTLSQFPSVSALSDIHLVETSNPLRELQQKKLDWIVRMHGWKIHLHESIDDIPRDDSQFTMVVAHEFFDALPFHVIEKTTQGWQEVRVSSSDPSITTPSFNPILPTNETPHTSPIHLRPVLSPHPTPASTLIGNSSSRFQKLAEGSRVEASLASFKLARKLAELLCTKNDSKSLGGCALIIDYGDDHVFGNSFRAFKKHKIVDVFQTPGDCDLTVNVDFAYLKEAMSDLVITCGPVSQADFLTRMGIDRRVKDLKESATDGNRKSEIDNAAKRLVDLTGMGNQYKVLGVVSSFDPSTALTSGVWPFIKIES